MASKVKGIFLWNPLIRFALESYLELSIVGVLNLTSIYFDTYGEQLSTVMSFMFLLLNGCLFIFAFAYLTYMSLFLRDNETISSLEELHRDLHMRNFTSTFYNVFFMLRRAIFIGFVFLFHEEPAYI